jgi:hypothetical protein
MRKPQLRERPAEAHLGRIDGEALAQYPLEIDATPARHSVAPRIAAVRTA